MDTKTAILVAAGLATCGWLYAARRARTLSRKQHTINVLLNANFDKAWRDAQEHIHPFLSAATGQNQTTTPINSADLMFVINHYEFIAACIRRGDLDERLTFDSERGLIKSVFEYSKDKIYDLRKAPEKQSLYENLEWLYDRWERPKSLLSYICAGWEYLRGSPMTGQRAKRHCGPV